MKRFLLVAFLATCTLGYSQSGNWTKNGEDIFANASSKHEIKEKKPLNSKNQPDNKKKNIESDIQIQKEIATHQNMEIEELLAENEKQRQQILILMEEIKKMRAEIDTLKSQLIE